MAIECQSHLGRSPQQKKEEKLIDIVNEVCREMGIKKVPKILIYERSKPNAASSQISGSLLFSTNLLEIESRDQLKDTVGHELTHYVHRGRDSAIEGGIVAAAFTVVTASMIAFNKRVHKLAGKPLDRVLNSFAGRFLGTILIIEGIGIIGTNAVLKWFKRRHELEADLGGARAAGAQNSVDSLKIRQERSKEISAEKEDKSKHKFTKYLQLRPSFFESHPSHEKRIEHIIKHNPGSFVEKYESGKGQQGAMIK